MDPIVEVLESTMAVQDPYIVTHQQRVAQISLAVAREMGLEEQKISNLEMAARLHDFGKISVPIGILSKPGKLSVPEMAIIKGHPVTGADMLKQLTVPAYTFLTIMQHHERINGAGYPFGLSGEDILLEARILGVADVVEAIAFPRPYRTSLGIETALGEISQNKGVLYDTSVVNAFTKLYSGNMFGNFFCCKSFFS
ncbi:MAG: HD domain-containing protein [Deltaproteobacteria bacterium]|nr:MAG: HD domain-containing protein [Deltaproteobacteria bacterium]